MRYLFHEGFGANYVLNVDRIMTIKLIQTKTPSFADVTLFMVSPKRHLHGENSKGGVLKHPTKAKHESRDRREGEMTATPRKENSTLLNENDLPFSLVVLITFGITDKKDNLKDALNDESDSCQNTIRGNGALYNLRRGPHVDFSNETVATIVSDADETTLPKTLNGNDSATCVVPRGRNFYFRCRSLLCVYWSLLQLVSEVQ